MGLTRTCRMTIKGMGRNAWRTAIAQDRRQSHLGLISYRMTNEVLRNISSTHVLFVNHTAWQVIKGGACASVLPVLNCGSPTAWQWTLARCSCMLFLSERCCAFHAACMLTSSRFMLGGYSDNGRRCQAGRSVCVDRLCLTGREGGNVNPHLCNKTQERAKPDKTPTSSEEGGTYLSCASCITES